MSPAAITDDYYKILRVEFGATAEAITKSYRQLAMKIHPDRNTKSSATKDFQLLAEAYDVLKDEHRRRNYDRVIYPELTKTRPAAQSSGTGFASTNTQSQSNTASDQAQIARLQERKRKRAAEWESKGRAFVSAVQELEKAAKLLEQEIRNLYSIAAAEESEERWKNSWAAWAISPFYKKAKETEEQKSAKDIARQERRLERDMKERRLAIKHAELQSQRSAMAEGQNAVDTGDRCDDAEIRVFQGRIWSRQAREREEREQQQMERQRQERERSAKIQRERAAQQAREMAEMMKRKAEESRAAQKRREEIPRMFSPNIRTSGIYFDDDEHIFTAAGMCGHGGWWPKIQGRMACPRCYDVWTYLLECPGCEMKACPKCQAEVRPKRRRGGR